LASPSDDAGFARVGPKFTRNLAQNHCRPPRLNLNKLRKLRPERGFNVLNFARAE